MKVKKYLAQPATANWFKTCQKLNPITLSVPGDGPRLLAKFTLRNCLILDRCFHITCIMLRPTFPSLRGVRRPSRLHSHPGLSCHVAPKEQWLLCGTLGGGGRGGLDGYGERLALTMREGERESRTWTPSSSAERSSALGEEERVEAPLRPFITSRG